jgi:hypothetical protein
MTQTYNIDRHPSKFESGRWSGLVSTLIWTWRLVSGHLIESGHQRIDQPSKAFSSVWPVETGIQWCRQLDNALSSNPSRFLRCTLPQTSQKFWELTVEEFCPSKSFSIREILFRNEVRITVMCISNPWATVYWLQPACDGIGDVSLVWTLTFAVTWLSRKYKLPHNVLLFNDVQRIKTVAGDRRTKFELTWHFR